MKNKNLIKGLFLIAIALAFGLPSLRYPMGHIADAGPGLFPLVMSCALLVIGVAVVIRSTLIAPAMLSFQARNIGLVMASLASFALVSTYVNLIAGIVALVFFAALATRSRSLSRNAAVVAGLVAVALAFRYLLGLQLPLL